MTVLYLVLGSLAGVLAGLFGIGGGVIMVIGMVTLLKLPLANATGTRLAPCYSPLGCSGRWSTIDAARWTWLRPLWCNAASQCFCCSWRFGCG